MSYDWTNKQVSNTNSVPTSADYGQINNQGLHNMNGVHSSDLAQGKNAHGARMQADAFYSGVFLERKRLKGEDLVFAKFSEKREIAKGLTQINLRKYKPLKAHIVPLVEGNPPAPDRASGVAIVANTRQYGRYMEFTDVFEFKVSDPVIQEYTLELADLAVEVIDMLAQAALLAEAQTFFAGKALTKKALVTASAAGTPTKPSTALPTIKDLRIIKLTMEAAKVKSINGFYQVLASPSVLFDLQTSDIANTYMAWGQTNSIIASDSLPNMFGLSFNKAMSAHTESVTEGGATATVHHTIVLGAKAYTKIEIAGNGGTQFFKKELGSAGTLDPINQRQTMGWKINSIGFKVTDPDAVVDYLSIPSQSDVIIDQFDYTTDALMNMGVTKEMATAINAIEGINIDARDDAATKVAEGITTIDTAKKGQFENIDKDGKVVVASDKATAELKSRIKSK